MQSTLAERVATAIRADIVTQRLRPGDPLPGEVELAKRLGVSRGIVREGRRQLVAAGLIEVSNGRRARVSALRPAPLDGFLANAMATRQLDVNHVLELRQAIEIAVAGLAAARRTDEDLDRLGRILERMRSRIGRGPPYIREDAAFHAALARATHNPLFAVLIDSMRDPMLKSMRASTAKRSSVEAFRQGHAAHEVIYDAVQAGDPAGAEAAMRGHFDEVADTLSH